MTDRSGHRKRAPETVCRLSRRMKLLQQSCCDGDFVRFFCKMPPTLQIPLSRTKLPQIQPSLTEPSIDNPFAALRAGACAAATTLPTPLHKSLQQKGDPQNADRLSQFQFRWDQLISLRRLNPIASAPMPSSATVAPTSGTWVRVSGRRI